MMYQGIHLSAYPLNRFFIYLSLFIGITLFIILQKVMYQGLRHIFRKTKSVRLYHTTLCITIKDTRYYTKIQPIVLLFIFLILSTAFLKIGEPVTNTFKKIQINQLSAIEKDRFRYLDQRYQIVQKMTIRENERTTNTFLNHIETKPNTFRQKLIEQGEIRYQFKLYETDLATIRKIYHRKEKDPFNLKHYELKGKKNNELEQNVRYILHEKVDPSIKVETSEQLFEEPEIIITIESTR